MLMSTRDNNPELFGRESLPFGKPWGNWIEIWWTWCMNNPTGNNPVEDATGEFCCENQNDPNVWFLAGTFGGKAERNCNIPAGRAIFFPVVNDLISYAEYRDLKTEEELTAYAKNDLDTATDYQVVVDDAQLNGLEKYRVKSGLFRIVLPIEISPGVITANPTMAVSDGYWIFLKHLRVGNHTIFFKGEKRLYDEIHYSDYKGHGMFEVEVKYNITVVI
jgi:hypothetical protein